MAIFKNNVQVIRPAFLGANHWLLNALNEITILFGKNGSGKSLLLRGLRNADTEHCHYVIPERVGSLEFDPGHLSYQMNATSRKDQSEYNYSSSYRQQIISRIQGYFMARGSSRENTVKGNPSDLEDLIKFLLPDFSITLKAENPPYLLERLSNGERIKDVNLLSSGEAQLFTMALDVLTIAAIWEIDAKQSKVILIDEPDAHLHPDLQVRLADFIVRVMSRFNVQIIVSTHSTTLLSAFGQFAKERCSIIYMTKAISTYTAQPFTQNLKELSACLGGHALMGPLFGAPLLLVEGDDDYRIWSQVPRHGVINIAVLPANGDEIKQYQKLLENIFRSISEPRVMGHALIDGDKGLPVVSAGNTQDYIPYVKLNCHESENLYLTDEVLQDLGRSWEQAKEKLNAEADNFGNKNAAIKALCQENRRTVDCKNVINEVSKILDSKNVHWTTRVGNALGRQKPNGQLADFLGEHVLNSLWG